jgi:ABC-type antimicrobial peptide transport system, permease component
MVVQVAVFAGLIIGSYVIYNQMNLVKTSNYGYSKEQTLVCSIPDDADKDKQILFINALKNMPGIVSASRASSAPPLFGVSISFSSQSDKTGKQINAQRIECDENYKDALRLKLKEGEFFSTTDMDSLQRNIVVNEKFVSVMGLKNAVGEVISSGRYDKYLIKGVIKDYNGGSLYHKINPEVFTPPEYFSILFVVKLAPQNIGRGVASLKEKWNGYFPGTFCNYRFIDEQFDRLYKEDQKFAMLIGFFAVNAIMIAVIGLAGLTTYTITRKKKEIAIRKVLGASAPDIIYTLTKEIIVITLIGCLIIMPAANYFMELWLRKFAYKIAVTPWIYVFAFSVSILITVVSVIYPAVKTAFGNQMDSLRSE